jgi:hypothetical protein
MGGLVPGFPSLRSSGPLPSRRLAALLAVSLLAGAVAGFAACRLLPVGKGQGASPQLSGFCSYQLSRQGLPQLLECMLRARMPAATLAAVTVNGLRLPLSRPVAVRSPVIYLSVMGPPAVENGSLQAFLLVSEPGGGGLPAAGVEQFLSIPGSLPLPQGLPGTVAAANGSTPLRVEASLGIRGAPLYTLYAAVEARGPCSPVLEAYRGLEPIAVYTYAAETLGSASPSKIVVILPPGATSVRLSCLGGGRVEASLRLYRAGSAWITLEDPSGREIMSAPVPLAAVPPGYELVPPSIG